MIVAANYVESSSLIVTVLAVAFFAQGMSGTSWAAVSEIAPPEQLGLVGGLFNAAGNLAGIVTPVAIGIIVDATGSFVGALYFVGARCAVRRVRLIFIVGPLEPVSLGVRKSRHHLTVHARIPVLALVPTDETANIASKNRRNCPREACRDCRCRAPRVAVADSRCVHPGKSAHPPHRHVQRFAARRRQRRRLLRETFQDARSRAARPFGR